MTRVLLINQSFYPDLAASGQYLTDLAFSLQEQGAQVRVLTSKHAYIEQEVNSFSSFEEYRGITIRRIAVPGARWRQRYLRMLSSILLNIFLMLVYLLLPRNEKVVVLTSPPLLFWFIAFANMFRHHAELYFWSMDLNPQQAIETGWVKKESFLAHTLLCFNRFFLKKAKKIFALDEAMRERLLENGVPDDRIVLSPLWTDLARLAPLDRSANSFRKEIVEQYEFEPFIVMYSGNHSICHPLTCLLEAALELKSEPVLFLFIGGGARYSEVTSFKQKHDLPNIHCLPYQPVDRLRESLNAADLHVVSMGKSYVGLVHPSKLYGILATTTPLLLLGPELCPIAGLIQRENLGMVVSHEDSLSSVNAIKYFMTMNKDEYFGYVQRVAEVSKRYDKELLARTLAREIL